MERKKEDRILFYEKKIIFMVVTDLSHKKEETDRNDPERIGRGAPG